MKLISTLINHELAIKADIHDTGAKYRVTIRDNDSGNILGEQMYYESEAEAIEEALYLMAGQEQG